MGKPRPRRIPDSRSTAMSEELEHLCPASLIPRRMLGAGRSVAASRDARPRRLEIRFPEGLGCSFPWSLGPERHCPCAARLAACSCLAPSFIPLLRLFCMEISHPVSGLSSGPAGGGATWVLGCWMLGCQGARVLDARMPWCRGARVLGARVPGCWVPGCRDAPAPY